MPTHGFVGRRDELDLVSNLLMSGPHRLLTVIGPGGIGKTRLGAEAVRRVRAGGIRVHWVPLSRVSPGAELEAVQIATASAVIQADVSQRSAFDALVDTLRENGSADVGRRVVLVLDNGEHVANAVAHLITNLLNELPDLTIMATSRGPIGWEDERLINVPQLPASDALELFRQRAELVGHTLADEEIAAEICAHVHHNPLYIQLVAARLRYQALKSLRAGLTGRDDDGRLQWGFSEVIAWSYNLGSDKEKLLFRRLSVFAPADTNPDDTSTDAGACLEAIRAVCSDDEWTAADETRTRLSSGEIEGVLEALADQSLITIHIGDTGQKYSMHESLLVFASDRLRDEDPAEPARLARRHLLFYERRAVEAAARWFSPDELDVVEWAQSSWANIVTALDTSVTLPGEAAAGLRICRSMIDLRTWILEASIRDIRRYTERCLEASTKLEPQPTELQMDVRSALVWLMVRQGGEDAERLLEECIADCLADPENTDWRDHPETDYGLPALLLLALGTCLFMRMRDRRAVAVLELALRKFHEAGDPYEVWAGMFASLAAALLESAPKAHTIARRAVEQGQASGATWTTSWVQLGWAVTLTKHGDPQEAARVLREGLKLQLAVRDQWGAMWSVVLLTWALANMITGLDVDRARDRHIAIEIAQLIGLVGTVQNHLGVRVASMGKFADETEAAVATARDVLGEAEYIAERTHGAQLDTDELARVALGRLSRGHKPEPVTGRWGALTPREQQVALQVVAGKSNKAIATRHGVSTRTVDTQLSSILDKLGIKSRRDIRDHIPAEGRIR